MFELRLVDIQPSCHLEGLLPTRSRHGSCAVPSASLIASRSEQCSLFPGSHPPRLDTGHPLGLAAFGREAFLSSSAVAARPLGQLRHCLTRFEGNDKLHFISVSKSNFSLANINFRFLFSRFVLLLHFHLTDRKNDTHLGSFKIDQKSHLFRGHVDPLFRCSNSNFSQKLASYENLTPFAWESDTHKWSIFKVIGGVRESIDTRHPIDGCHDTLRIAQKRVLLHLKKVS